MILLALETTAKAASVALLRDGVVCAGHACDPAHKHAETVLPAVRLLLRQCALPLDAVDVFAVDVGPGSFTGVRIGVCMANAFAFACHKPVVGVDALRALYQRCLPSPEPVCALIDARNGNAYAARYAAGRCVEAPQAVSLEAYGAGLAGTRLVGDVPGLCEPPVWPDAASVGLAAMTLLATAQPEVRPLYLRPSQAERLAEGRQ